MVRRSGRFRTISSTKRFLVLFYRILFSLKYSVLLLDNDKLDATALIKFDGQVIAASGDCDLYAESRADVFSYDPVTMNKSDNFRYNGNSF